MSELSSDAPIEVPSQDCLGYSTFAKTIADSLAKVPMAEGGSVVGLCGEWGSGKSSLMNLVVHHIKDSPSQSTNDIFFFYNPWLFTGQENLIKHFFQQLLEVLRKENRKNSFFKKWKNKFSYWSCEEDENGFDNLIDSMETFASVVSSAYPPLAPIGFFTKSFRYFKPKSLDVHEIKKRIEDLLLKQNRKIFVVIDDVDRLSNVEINEVFRLIKSVANFPNVTYLVAFDRDIVARALEDVQAGCGLSFLEKIIQIPVDIPLPDKTLLRQFFISRVQVFLKDLPEEVVNDEYLSNIFYNCIDPFLSKPRDVIRVLNSTSLTLPAIRNEVNPLDFLSLEIIRIFYPKIYDLIRNHQELFAGPSRPNSENEEERKFHDLWRSEILSDNQGLNRKIVKSLSFLFPRLNAVFSNVHYSSDWCKKWKLARRVCSNAIFPVYFRFGLDSDAIPREDFIYYISEARDRNLLKKVIRNFLDHKTKDGKTKFNIFISNLRDYLETEDRIGIDEASNILTALIEIGDEAIKIDKQQTKGVFSFPFEWEYQGLLALLLEKIPAEQRLSLIKNLLKKDEISLYSLSKMIVERSRENGSLSKNESTRKESENLLEQEEVMTLENLLEKRLEQRKGEICSSVAPISLSYIWNEFSDDKDAVSSWFKLEVLQNRNNLLSFLENSASTSRSQGIGSYYVKSQISLNIEGFSFLINPEDLLQACRDLVEDNTLSAAEKEILDAILSPKEDI